MLFTVDRSGVLSNARRTATGGYLVDATLARVGKLEYSERELPEGTPLVQFNTADVLQGSLDGISTAPVTNRHPPKFVTADTYKQYAVGHAVGPARFVDDHIHATLAIQDADLIRDIELGVCREVSMGYSFDVEDDGRRSKIEWNHIAIVPAGRAGKSVSLVFDSAEIPQEKEAQVFKISGADVAEDAVQAAIDSLEGQLAAAQAELEAVKAEKTATDAALALAVSDEAVDAAVAARIARDQAVADKAAKLARVAAGYPSVALDGKSDDFVDALVVALDAKEAEDAEDLRKIQDKRPGGEKIVQDAAPVAPPVDARAEMIRRNREAASK